MTADYLKCKMTVFEIQTRDICTAPLPLQLEGLICQLHVHNYIQEPSLKFETGSYFLKSTKKPVTLGKQDEVLQYMYVMF